MASVTLPKHRWTSDKREARIFTKAQMHAWIEALRADDASWHYGSANPRLSKQTSWKTVAVIVDLLVCRKPSRFSFTKEYLVADTLDGGKTNSVLEGIEAGYVWKG